MPDPSDGRLGTNHAMKPSSRAANRAAMQDATLFFSSCAISRWHHPGTGVQTRLAIFAVPIIDLQQDKLSESFYSRSTYKDVNGCKPSMKAIVTEHATPVNSYIIMPYYGASVAFGKNRFFCLTMGRFL